MTPHRLTGLIIECEQYWLAKQAPAPSAVSFRPLVIVGQIGNAVTFVGIDIEESRVRVEARRRPVRTTAGGDVDQRAVYLRLFTRIGNGLPIRIHAFRPV